MTARQTFTTSDRFYVISPDARLRAGRIPQSVVSARFIDEHTGELPAAIVTAKSVFPLLTPRSTNQGLAGLTGVPERALPQLGGAPYDVDFSVAAHRYLSFATSVHFASQPAFPNTFARRDLGVIEMHREPVQLFGRVIRATAAGNVPVAGVVMSITGYWLRIPPAIAAPPASAPNLMSLSPGVYLNRSAATARVRRRDFALTPDASELLGDAPSGSVTWLLSNRNGLVAGEIVRVDAADPGRTEYLIVKSVSGSTSPAQPAQVVFRYACRIDHRPGATVERVTAAAPGVNNALISDAVPGDATVLTAALAGIGGATTIEIDDGSPNPEYHAVSLFTATTDAGGFYRLPVLNRVGQLELTANDGVNPPVRTLVVPNYDSAQHLVNITLN